MRKGYATAYVVATLNLSLEPPVVIDVRCYGESAERLSMMGSRYCYATLFSTQAKSFEQACQLALDTAKAAPHLKWAASFLEMDV